MGVLTTAQAQSHKVAPRSIIPGRQRWDIGVLLGRSRVAELLEAGLAESAGIGAVRANPVTGRLLVHHDTALSSAQVSQLVREAAVNAASAHGPAVLTPISRVSDSQRTALPAIRPPHQTPAMESAVGAGAAALVLAGLVRSPLLRLGAVLGATAVVIWRGWQKSRRARILATPARPTTSPLRQILGSHRRQFSVASALSVAAQTFYILGAMSTGWMITVLIKGPTASLLHLGLTTAASQLTFLGGAILLALLSYAATSFVSGVMWRNLAQTVQHEWRKETYAHVQRAQLRDLEGDRSSRLAQVLTADIDQLGRFFAGPVSSLLQIAPASYSSSGRSSSWLPASPGSPSCRRRPSPGCRSTTRSGWLPVTPRAVSRSRC